MHHQLKAVITNSASEQSLSHYLGKRSRFVEGWLSEEAAALTVSISNLQDQLGISGSFAEIGVHHGKLFLLLCLLKKKNEKALAIDLFSDQHENLDNSGHGSLSKLKSNLQNSNINLAEVEIQQKNSTDLSHKDICLYLSNNQVRIFSVDGGHTAEITAHDLSTSFHSLCEGGVIILDDYFNHGWPGVSEGFHCFARNEKLFPFAIGGNKLCLTNTEESHNFYLEGLRNLFQKDHTKDSVFLGESVLILEPFRSDPTLLDRISSRIKRLF